MPVLFIGIYTSEELVERMSEICVDPHKPAAQQIDQIPVIGAYLTFYVREKIAGDARGKAPSIRLNAERLKRDRRYVAQFDVLIHCTAGNDSLSGDGYCGIRFDL